MVKKVDVSSRCDVVEHFERVIPVSPFRAPSCEFCASVVALVICAADICAMINQPVESFSVVCEVAFELSVPGA